MDGLTDGLWLMNDGDIAMQISPDTALHPAGRGDCAWSRRSISPVPYDARSMNLNDDCTGEGSHQEHEGFENWHHGMYRQRAGEMVDADYGYVGAGVGRIALSWQGKVERGIPEAEAVEHLLQLIKEDQERGQKK